MSDNELGQLFRLIFEWQMGNASFEDSEEISPTVRMAFAFMKHQFHLDNAKYQKTVERNQRNGEFGGRPKSVVTEQIENPTKPKKPTGLFENPTKPKKPDNGNDNEKDNGNDNDLERIVAHFNATFKTSVKSQAGFKANYLHWAKIHDRDKIMRAISNARDDPFWRDALTPTILFRRKNKNKEDVDYIEDFANRNRGRPENTERKRQLDDEKKLLERKKQLEALKQNFDRRYYDQKYGPNGWRNFSLGKEEIPGVHILTRDDRQAAWSAFEAQHPAEAQEINQLTN
jgi:hypothetical protein